MIDRYVEVLVKRNVEEKKQLRKKIILLLIIVTITGATIAKMPVLYLLLIPEMLGYYFMVLKYCVEYEYFYMDGELTISKIYNMSRRKTIAILNSGMIKLITSIGSADLQEFQGIRSIDCTANVPEMIPYIVVCEYQGALKAIHIQMNDELYLELKRDMPDKVKKY